MTPFKGKHSPARRRLGQHFLKSPGVLAKIIGEIDPRPEDLIIEIGPGHGALTFPLAAKAGHVVAIEKDPRFLPDLQEKRDPRLTVVSGDVLEVDLRKLIRDHKEGFRRVTVAGNLPYSISSPLLFKVLEEREAFEKCVFLVQKEVAERICAGPGSKDYAPISILLQLRFSATFHITVRPGSFSPPPKVDSALISLEKRPIPLHPVANERKFQRFLRDCFQQRRKTLVNNLIASGLPAALVEEMRAELGLDRKIRPEQVPIEGFVELFDLFRAGSGHRSA